MITNELYSIVHAGDVDGLVNWLNQKPDDLNADIGDGFKPLHVACLFGQEAVVRYLVGRGALVNSNADNAGAATPLHLATGFRDEVIANKLILFLLDHGAELNAAQAGGQTPLHHAVARASLLLTQTLVQGGADPLLKDQQGRSPMDLAPTDLAHGESLRTSLKGAYRLTPETRT